MFDRLMEEIRGFTQHLNESLIDAWLRMKDLLRSCHGHGLSRGTTIQIFYHGLDEATQAILDVGGIFLYKTPNEAHQLLEDRVLLKLGWSKDTKAKPLQKTIAFAEDSNNSKLMEKIQALTTKIGSQFKEIKGEMKEMRDGCNSCGGPHSSLECDHKPMGVRKKKKKQTMPTEDIREGDIEETTTVEILKIEVKINVPLVDVLASMPNYGKFLKDLVSNKRKMEQISAAFLNKECSAIIQNKLPPKLGDPGSFLIPCTFANSVECLALAQALT
ncbi:hypothetical protein Tco_0300611 [Tanacetum coccineum]